MDNDKSRTLHTPCIRVRGLLLLTRLRKPRCVEANVGSIDQEMYDRRVKRCVEAAW